MIATGDQFISSESYVKELQTKFNALACEMEGASVARVADEFHVPCAILRCMSDKPTALPMIPMPSTTLRLPIPPPLW